MNNHQGLKYLKLKHMDILLEFILPIEYTQWLRLSRQTLALLYVSQFSSCCTQKTWAAAQSVPSKCD